MKRSRFTEAEIAAILEQVGFGQTIADLARTHGVHPNTIRIWREKYAGIGLAEIARMRQLEADNARMKQTIQRLDFELRALQEFLQKKGWSPHSAEKL